MEFPGVFIKNHRSWFVTLEFPPTNKGRVFTRSRKSGKIKEFVRGSAKSQWENFYPCKLVTCKNIICTQKFVQLSCIWQSVVYMMLLFAFGIKMVIVRSPPPTHPPIFKGGREEILITSHGGGNLKNQKRGWEYGAGAGLLKRGGGGWHFSYAIFSKFIILHLEITLPFAKLCYAFEKKLFFLSP